MTNRQLVTTTEKPMTAMEIEKKYDQKELKAIKDMFAKGLSDEQFTIYCMTCNRLNLDPVAKHIYGILRTNKDGSKQLTIQIGIDGFRFIADRTGAYAPGETEYLYDKNKNLIGAKVWVKKMVQGQAFAFSETALMSEYRPKMNDFMWKQFPHTMIAKCAEAKALRRAFPNEFCGVYSKEEMSQANYTEQQTIEEAEAIVVNVTLSNAEMHELKEIVSHDIHIIKKIIERFNVLKFSDLMQSDFDIIKQYASNLIISPLQLNNIVNIVSKSADPQKLENYILNKSQIENLSDLNQKQYRELINLHNQKKQNGENNDSTNENR